MQPEIALSYIRLFIGDWPEMLAILSDHLNPIGSKKQSPTAGLIGQKKLHEALNGPWGHFFKMHLDAFLEIKRDFFFIRTKNEPAFINAKKTILAPTVMEDRSADITARSQDNVTPKNSIESIPGLDRRLKKLNSQLPEHLQAFQKLAKACYNESIKALEAMGLSVNDFERQALFDDEPLSEIHKRYQSLNLKVPTPDKHNPRYFFLEGLKLKLYLCIHSILSRLQQDNSHDTIVDQLKRLQKIFNQCEQFEKKIIDEQKKNIDQANQVTEDNNSSS